MTKTFVNTPSPWRLQTIRPTKLELAILKVLWESGPRSVREIQGILNESKPTGYTTVLKMLQIMTEKGLVERDETVRPQIYRAKYRRNRRNGIWSAICSSERLAVRSRRSSCRRWRRRNRRQEIWKRSRSCWIESKEVPNDPSGIGDQPRADSFRLAGRDRRFVSLGCSSGAAAAVGSVALHRRMCRAGSSVRHAARNNGRDLFAAGGLKPAFHGERRFSNLAGSRDKLPIAAAAGWLNWLQRWALPLWSLGVVVFSARLMLGCRHAFLLRRRGEAPSSSVIGVVTRLTRLMRVDRPVRVLISSMSDSPSVVGWLRPVILLPAATLIGLTPLQLEAILAHEIAHIRRHDYFVNILQMVVETLLFYHPAVWWTSKRIRIERELCCDDLAVRFSGNALRYARALTVLEKQRLRAPQVAMASTGGSLLYRIQRLVGASPKEQSASRLPIAIAAGIGIFCFALNINWIQGQDAAGVNVDLGGSSVIHRSAVRYPESAKKQGITGTVQVEVSLDAAGDVSDARILSGPEELRKATLQSVLDWHFTRDAARSTRLISISFSEKGTQVQVREPEANQAVVLTTKEARRVEEAKVAVAEASNRAKKEQLIVLGGRRQELEKQIESLELHFRALSSRADQNNEGQKALEARLAAVRLQLHALQPLVGGGHENIERSLTSIRFSGLSDSVQADLLSRLPVREGDLVSPERMEEAAAAVRELRRTFPNSIQGYQ